MIEDIKSWLICPSEICTATMAIISCTYYEIRMECPKCQTKVILKRYISGNFGDVFALHSELSDRQREFLG